jgi:hypothetical protein
MQAVVEAKTAFFWRGQRLRTSLERLRAVLWFAVATIAPARLNRNVTCRIMGGWFLVRLSIGLLETTKESSVQHVCPQALAKTYYEGPEASLHRGRAH